MRIFCPAAGSPHPCPSPSGRGVPRRWPCRANVLSLKHLCPLGRDRERVHEDRGRRRRAGRALFRDPDEEGGAGAPTSPSTSATGPTTRSASASSSPTQTLDNFERYDPASYRRITQEFAYWDDIAIHFKGTRAPHRRQRLLRLRAAHAAPDPAGAGRASSASSSCSAPRSTTTSAVRRRRPRRRSPTASTAASASAHRDAFRPEVDLRPNKFAWMGSTRPLDAFTFIFEETEWGAVHRPRLPVRGRARSTWVFETDPETFDRAGLDAHERGGIGAASWSAIFGGFLDGHPVLDQPLALAQLPDDPQRALGARTTSSSSATPRRRRISRSAPAPSSPWRTRSRSTRRFVTRARRRAMRWRASRPAGARRSSSTQHAADVSLVWFEHVAPLLGFRPGAVRLRRDDAREGDHLRQPAPARAGLRRRGRPALRAARCARTGFDVDVEQPARADVPAVPPARHGAAEPGRGVADVHVLGRWTACRATGTSSTTARARSAAPG